MTTTVERPAPRVWAPLGDRSFRFLWLGQSFSLLGDGFSYIAFSWITLSLTGSTLALGYVLALQAVPRALLTLVGGSLSDTWSPRRLMMLSSWVRAAVMITVGLLGLAGGLGLWMLMLAAAVFGAVDAFFQPARSSILPSVVSRDLLGPANALLSVGSRVSSVLGPAVGGVVVAASNAHYAFIVDGVCFALCGLMVARVRASRSVRPGAAADDGLARRIRAGIRYAWDDPRIRAVIAVDMVVTFCYAGPFTIGFATLARYRLHGGSATLGLLGGALAGGAILGALAGGSMTGRRRVGLMIAALAGWLAGGMALLGLVHDVTAAVATVLAMGFGIGFQGVFGLSWIQRNIQGSVLSRVIALDMVLGYAMAPISLVLCGALARTHPATMFVGTATILAVTALAVLASRTVRQMD